MQQEPLKSAAAFVLPAIAGCVQSLSKQSLQLILYLLAPSDQTLLYGAISVAIILLSIPFLFSKRALCSVVYDSAVFGRIARDFCGFRQRSFRVEDKPTGRKNAAFILGLPFGILSCFVNPAWVLILMLGLIFAYIILLNPECGYLSILLILPFLVVLPHPSILLALRKRSWT